MMDNNIRQSGGSLSTPTVQTSGDGLRVTATSTSALGGTVAAGISNEGIRPGVSYSVSGETANPDGSKTVNHASVVGVVGSGITASASTVTSVQYANGLDLRVGAGITVPMGSSPTIVAGVRGDYNQPTLSPYFTATAAITSGNMVATLGVGACSKVSMGPVQTEVCGGVTVNSEGKTRAQFNLSKPF